MKKIILLLALIPNLAFAQGWQIPNPAGTPRALPTPGTVMTKANVDTFGNQQVVSVDGSGSGETQSVIPVSNAVNLNGVANRPVGGLRLATDAVEAGSTTSVINATAHLAAVGDHLRFDSSSANPLAWSPISAVTANTITLANPVPVLPVVGNSFIIERITPISASGASGGSALMANIDFAFQGSSANGILKAEDAASADGDAGVANIYKRLDTPASQTGTDGDYTIGIANGRGVPYFTLDYRAQDGATAIANGILKLEDAAAASGDALVGVAGQANTALATNAANLDYVTMAHSTTGAYLAAPVYDPQMANTVQATKLEDQASANGDAGFLTLSRNNSALAANAATNSDYVPIQSDELGRTITTLAPAGESWQGCSSNTTGTSVTAIKAAVPSNRIYVTSISCSNKSAVASEVLFYDGAATVIYGGAVGTQAATGGGFTATLPVPLRGTVNTAFNFAMTTTATNTLCCASGYISVN